MAEWRDFKHGEEWWAGRVLWVWCDSWKEPRLVLANPNDGHEFEWTYLKDGSQIEDDDGEYPTHCCEPNVPVPPKATVTPSKA